MAFTDTENSPPLFSDNAKVIWQSDSEPLCHFVSGRKKDSTLFEKVLHVRIQTDQRWPDQRTPVDEYSDQYCMFVEGEAVGCLGVSRAVDGDIYLQEFSPRALLDDFRDTLVSAYRFRLLSDFRRTSRRVPGVTLSRHMVREAWREQLAKGASLDVINIETSHVPLYSRMGYVLCEGYDYTDPILGTPSSIMFLPIDPDRESIVKDLIRESDIRLSFHDVMRSLTRTRVAVGL